MMRKTPTMIKPLAFGSFLTDLKNFIGVTEKSTAEAAELLKTAESGVKVFDDTIAALPVDKSPQGFITMADQPVGAIDRLVRSADLEGIVRLSNNKVPITTSDITNFHKLVGETPEFAFKNVDDAATITKRTHPELDVTPDNMDNLSAGSKEKVKK